MCLVLHIDSSKIFLEYISMQSLKVLKLSRSIHKVNQALRYFY